MSSAPEPTFDADPDFPSGEWTGFFLQGRTRYRQDLTLTFSRGRLTGTGIDRIGRFAVQGHYNRKSHEVWWTKSYFDSHDVHYRGFREIKGIWGTWEIGSLHDGFHIWPRSEGDARSQQHAKKLETAKDRPPPSPRDGG